MTEFLLRLKQRKLVQWALAYVAFAFALLQGVDIVAQRFAWPDQLEKLLILALAIGGGLLWRFERNAPSTSLNFHAAANPDAAASAVSADRRSIAVLPFENLSSDKDNAYFAAGMQDEILTRLSKIGTLRVISRTSTLPFASHPENLPEIARKLGVA